MYIHIDIEAIERGAPPCTPWALCHTGFIPTSYCHVAGGPPPPAPSGPGAAPSRSKYFLKTVVSYVKDKTYFLVFWKY